jgi:hypothetical protein
MQYLKSYQKKEKNRQKNNKVMLMEKEKTSSPSM